MPYFSRPLQIGAMSVPEPFAKHVYKEISQLDRLNNQSDPKFTLEHNPFEELDDDLTDQQASVALKQRCIVGLIYPDSAPYNAGSYRIEMKLGSTFPFNPPEVQFLTPIYHPNVDKDGKFCNEILLKTGTWAAAKSLVEVVKAVTEHIDKPNVEFSMSVAVGTEYNENRAEFERKAAQHVREHALPRDGNAK